MTSALPRLPADVWRIWGAELTGGWPAQKDTWRGITPEARANADLMTTLSLVCRAWHEDVQYLWKPFYHSIVKEVRPSKAVRYLGAAHGTQHDMPSRWYQLRVKYYLTKPWRQARKTRHADRHRARVIMGYVSKKQARAGARHRAMLREMRTLVRQ